MFAEIGNFLQKNLVEPIDKAIIRPIDKAIIQPIDKAIFQPLRHVTDKDYALRHEHAEIAALEKRNAELRPQFFQGQQDLAEAEADYLEVTEDFARAHGRKRLEDINLGRPEVWAPVDVRASKPEVLQAIEDGGRFVLKTVSFGLTEAIFNKDEIPRERAFLKKKIAYLRDEKIGLDAAIHQLRKAVDQYNLATAEIRAEHAKLGDDATASDARVHTARETAQRKIVLRLMEDDLSPEKISEITGIPPEVVADVVRSPAS